MKINEFILRLANISVDNEIVYTIQKKYSSKDVPDMVKQLLSAANDGVFFDEECRLLSYEEILFAAQNLNIDFAKHGIIPFFDIADNDYIVYNFKKKNWELFNIIEEEAFKSEKQINDIIKTIYGKNKMPTVELTEDVVQQIAEIITQYVPKAWFMIAIEAILKNDDLSFTAEALDSEDVQYDIDIDSDDKNTLKAILLKPMKDQSCVFFRFEVNDEGNYSIESA